MSRRAWSPAAEDKLRALYATTPLPRLAFLLKRTEKAVRSRAKVLGIRKTDRRPWTRAEERILRKRYPNEQTRDIARDLGRTVTTTYQRANALGLRKSDAYFASDKSGRVQRGKQNPAMRATQFKPGQPSWSKGTKGVVGVQPGCRATQFKKGRAPSESHRYVPIGTERLDTKRGVTIRKISDDTSIYPAARWRPVHVLVWEAAHGPVPAGYVCVFKPGLKTLDSALITAERLEVVTHAELMRRNSYHTRYPELAPLIQLKGALNRKINRRLKEAA